MSRSPALRRPDRPLRPPRRGTPLALAVLAALALLGLAGCDEYWHDVHHEHWLITVDNEGHRVLDVYLDDRFRATLTPGSTATFHEVAEGHHLLEAFDEGHLVASRSLYLDGPFVWVLE